MLVIKSEGTPLQSDALPAVIAETQGLLGGRSQLTRWRHDVSTRIEDMLSL